MADGGAGAAGAPLPAPPDSALPPVDATADARARGNAAFNAKDYAGAIAAYTEALEVCPGHAVVLSNRSAAHLLAGDAAAAVADARAAVAADPAWLKARLRLAAGLEKLGQHWEAAAVYEEALDSLAHGDVGGAGAGAAASLTAALRRARTLAHGAAIPSEGRFLEVWGLMAGDVRLRLALLATLWNASTKPERLGLVQQFMELTGGGGAQAASPTPPLRADPFGALPMDNYEDVVPPRGLVAFYSGLPSGGRAALFASLWAAASSVEQGLVRDDLAVLFGIGTTTPPPQQQQQAAQGGASGGGASGGGGAGATPAAPHAVPSSPGPGKPRVKLAAVAASSSSAPPAAAASAAPMLPTVPTPAAPHAGVGEE
jgi:hypothetical protein